MARKSVLAHNDVLQHVFKASKLSKGEFAKRCNQQKTNVSAYLSKDKPLKLGAQALLRCLEDYYGWPVIVHREVAQFNGSFSDFPEEPGIYVFYDSAGNVVYFGKAKNLKIEAKQSFGRTSSFDVRLGPDLNKRRHGIGDFVKFVSLYEIQNARIRTNLEVLLLHVFPNQSHNHNLGKFK